MTTSRLTTGVALFATIAVATALGGTATAQTAQADPDHAVHHPEGAVTAQAAPPAAQPPATPGTGAPGSMPGAGPMGAPGMMMGGPGMMGPGGMMGTPDEGGRRRIVVLANTSGGRDVAVVVADMREVIAATALPAGISASLEGTFAAQEQSMRTIGGLSAHADQHGLLEWYGASPNHPPVVLAHGENPAREALAQRLRQRFGVDVALSQPGMTREV